MWLWLRLIHFPLFLHNSLALTPLVLAAISHVVRKISQVTPVQFSVQLHLNSLAV